MVSDRKLKSLLTNSIWIVPKQTLKAFFIVNNITTKVKDQTVWVIDSYDSGYFFGTSYTTLNKTPQSKMKLIGSITPNGNVLISFYSGDSMVTGIGTFSEIGKEYKFLMQMSNIISSDGMVQGLTHWSYMESVTRTSYEYQNLPGVGISVPEFISLFE